jgi:hypothetical protein
VFEKHPEFAAPNDVLLSLLGVSLYQQKYPNGAAGQAVNAEANARMFTETGHKVGGVFLDYWLKNGGLAQQGYPISDEFTEVSDLNGKPYKVQYFQRAAFEWHPENAPPYDVLLSQLGTLRNHQIYDTGLVPSPTTQPTPPAPPNTTTIPTATHTQTPEPTDTPEPRPTRTAVPTVCPNIVSLGMQCRSPLSWFVIVSWNVTGGGSQIRGEVTFDDQYGSTTTIEVSGRSGSIVYGPTCTTSYGYYYLTFTLELHDECDHSASSTCSITLRIDPCP